MTHVACKSKLRSVVRSFMHSCARNWVAVVRAVVYYAQPAHAFSAGIKCWHYRSLTTSVLIDDDINVLIDIS